MSALAWQVHAQPSGDLQWSVNLGRHGVLISDAQRNLDVNSAVRQALGHAPQVADASIPACVRLCFWLVSEVRNDSPSPELALRIGNVLFDSIEVFVLDGDRLIRHQTFGRALSSRTIERDRDIYYTLDLRIPPGASRTFAIRMDATVLNQVAFRRGYTPARFVLLGWSVLALASCWALLAAFGVFPVSFHVGAIMLAAACFEMLTLSLALADRVRLLREEKARLDEQHRTKSLYLATLSHEIRSPLSGILGIVELLRQSKLSGGQAEFVDMLRYSGNALLSLVNNLLDVGTEGAGRFRQQQEEFEPAPLVNSIVVLYSARARDQGIYLDARVAPSIPRRLLGDGFCRVHRRLSNRQCIFCRRK